MVAGAAAAAAPTIPGQTIGTSRAHRSSTDSFGRGHDTIRELEHELQACQYRQEKMKSDFEYNLKLLEERDAELEHYDRMFSEYSVVLKSRDSDLAQLMAKLARAEAKLDEARSERADDCRRLTKELAAQRLAADRARAALREAEHSLRARVAALQQNLQAKQREVVALQTASRESSRALEDAKSTEHSLRARVAALKEMSQAQCGDLVALQESARASKQALDDYEHKFENLSRKIRTIESDHAWALENEKKSSQKRVDTLESELRDVSRERDSLRGTVKEMKEAHAALQRDKAAQTDELVLLRTKFDARSAELAEKERELVESARKCREHAARLGELQAENSRTLERQKLEFQANAEELRRAVTAQRDTAARAQRDARAKIARLEGDLRRAQLAAPTTTRRSRDPDRSPRHHPSCSQSPSSTSTTTPSPGASACPSSLLSELATLRSRNTSLEEQLTRSRNEIMRLDDTALRSEIVRLKEHLHLKEEENRKLVEKQKFYAEDRDRLLEISNKLKAELSRHQPVGGAACNSSVLRPAATSLVGARYTLSASGEQPRSTAVGHPAIEPTHPARSTPAPSSYPTALLDGRSSVRRRFGL